MHVVLYHLVYLVQVDSGFALSFAQFLQLVALLDDRYLSEVFLPHLVAHMVDLHSHLQKLLAL